ncbi:hypothetical protein IQ07DRAFT_639009 [Pyrenochaeta sp. DS3sAY3a]|nr:hypothetical protein IQ07DRAFT_639009 [Pyrenochaeta sp. DS3sAY3a]
MPSSINTFFKRTTADAFRASLTEEKPAKKIRSSIGNYFQPTTAEAFRSSLVAEKPSDPLPAAADGIQDWVLNPDFNSFNGDDLPESGETFEDDGLEFVGTREKRVRIPEKFTKHLDTRCGSPFFNPGVSKEELARRKSRFEDKIRDIILHLQILARTPPPGDHKVFTLFAVPESISSGVQRVRHSRRTRQPPNSSDGTLRTIHRALLMNANIPTDPIIIVAQQLYQMSEDDHVSEAYAEQALMLSSLNEADNPAETSEANDPIETNDPNQLSVTRRSWNLDGRRRSRPQPSLDTDYDYGFRA